MTRAALLLALVALSSEAHVLEESTARLTWRDGHLELGADVDLVLAARADATALATMSEGDLEAEREHLRTVFQQQTVVTVDGEPAPLTLREFPSATELRIVAATLSASGHQHGGLVRLSFESTRVFPRARLVALTLPAVLGATVISFVEPTSRYTPAGASAAFEVHAVKAPPVERAAVLPSWVTVSACVLVMSVALVLAFASRKGTR